MNSAQSQVAQAESATKTSKAEAVKQGKNAQAAGISAIVMAGAFLVLLVFVSLVQKTPQGRAFKERMSERLSGSLFGRQNEKKQPLLGKKTPFVENGKFVPDQSAIGA